MSIIIFPKQIFTRLMDECMCKEKCVAKKSNTRVQEVGIGNCWRWTGGGGGGSGSEGDGGEWIRGEEKKIKGKEK